MEKTGDYEIHVYKQNGILLMRLPGGQTVPYDGRFGYPPLNEGDSFIQPIME